MQFFDRLELVIGDLIDHPLVQLLRLSRHAKGAGGKVPPGPARDLRQLVGAQLAHPVAVEFRRGRKGDVFNIKVQPHADGIGGDQIIHIAVLIHLDLRIAGPRG